MERGHWETGLSWHVWVLKAFEKCSNILLKNEPTKLPKHFFFLLHEVCPDFYVFSCYVFVCLDVRFCDFVDKIIGLLFGWKSGRVRMRESCLMNTWSTFDHNWKLQNFAIDACMIPLCEFLVLKWKVRWMLQYCVVVWSLEMLFVWMKESHA